MCLKHLYVVSSANIKTLENSGRSFIYSIKSIGPECFLVVQQILLVISYVEIK